MGSSFNAKPLARRKAPQWVPVSPVAAPFPVAEHLRLPEGLRDAGAVHRDKVPELGPLVPAVTEQVNPPGDELLPCAGLSGDKDRGVAGTGKGDARGESSAGLRAHPQQQVPSGTWWMRSLELLREEFRVEVVLADVAVAPPAAWQRRSTFTPPRPVSITRPGTRAQLTNPL